MHGLQKSVKGGDRPEASDILPNHQPPKINLSISDVFRFQCFGKFILYGRLGTNRRLQSTFHKCLQCAVCRSSDFFHRILQSAKYQSSEAATNLPFPYVNLGILNRQVLTRCRHLNGLNRLRIGLRMELKECLFQGMGMGGID